MADNDLDRAGKRRFTQAFSTTMRVGGAGRKRGYVIAVVAAVVISAGAAVAIGATASGKPAKASGPANLSALSRQSTASPSASPSGTRPARPGTPRAGNSTAPGSAPVQPGGVPASGSAVPVPSSARSTGPGAPTEPAPTTNNGTFGAPPSAAPSTPPPPAPTSTPPATPTPGSLFITGQVSCESGASVEGVWVGTTDGPGWASWTKLGNGSTSDWWYTLPVNEPYHLNVGCGGSTSKWTLTITTPTVTGGHNSFNCYDGKTEADYDHCVSR